MTAIDETDVLIVGGGILGCVAMYHLAEFGIETLLVERGELNREASGTNAGSLHFQILRQPDYAPERLARLRHSVELHAEAARIWRTVERDLDTDLGVRLGGGLLVADTAEQFEALREKHRVERAMGMQTELLETSDMLQICPHLASDLRGADYHPGEGFANPLLVAPAYARRAVERGARVRIKTEVIAIEQQRGGFKVQTGTGEIHARRVVNAAGAAAGRVAAMVGLSVPIVGHALHVNVTEPWPILLPGLLIQHAGRRLTLKQTQYGTFIIGGGWRARLDHALDRKVTIWDSMVGNVWNACRVMPVLARVQVVRTWAGIIATSEDHRTILGESARVRGYYLLHPGDAGFTLGPVVGRLLAELLHSGTTSLPVAQYAIEVDSVLR
jgi:glycine/D-amino acid oxidase-like deaminating enzyme